MSKIVDVVRLMVKSQIKDEILMGEVKSFNSQDWTCTIALHSGGEVEEVTVRSVLNSEATGIFIEPKKGSYVICSRTDGKLENLKILLFSEIENVEIMPAKKIKLRGDDFGGIVKSKSVADEDKKIIDDINAFRTAILGYVPPNPPIPDSGFLAFMTALQNAWAANPLISKPKTFYENQNIEHG